MIDPKNYGELPDGMSSHELRPYFVQLLNSFQIGTNFMDSSAFLEALDELSDRQWHTYELLDDMLRKKVEQMLIYLLTPSMSLNEAEHAVSIVARLGLPKILVHLSEVAKVVVMEDVREELESSAQDLAKTVSDPYWGM